MKGFNNIRGKVFSCSFLYYIVTEETKWIIILSNANGNSQQDLIRETILLFSTKNSALSAQFFNINVHLRYLTLLN